MSGEEVEKKNGFALLADLQVSLWLSHAPRIYGLFKH